MKQEKVSVNVGRALPQLSQWRIKVCRFKEAAISFIQRTKGETKNYQASFEWVYSGIEFNVVLYTVDKIVWKVVKITCNTLNTVVRVSKRRYYNNTRMYRALAPRNAHHRNPIAAFVSYA
jgi:hypothetical protein